MPHPRWRGMPHSYRSANLRHTFRLRRTLRRARRCCMRRTLCRTLRRSKRHLRRRSFCSPCPRGKSSPASMARNVRRHNPYPSRRHSRARRHNSCRYYRSSTHPRCNAGSPDTRHIALRHRRGPLRKYRPPASPGNCLVSPPRSCTCSKHPPSMTCSRRCPFGSHRRSSRPGRGCRRRTLAARSPPRRRLLRCSDRRARTHPGRGSGHSRRRTAPELPTIRRSARELRSPVPLGLRADASRASGGREEKRRMRRGGLVGEQRAGAR